MGLTKQPSEVDYFEVDFRDRLNAGDTLSSITSTAVSPSGLTIDQESIIESTKVKFRAQSGTSGTLYTITFVVATTLSDSLEGDVAFFVQDTATGFGVPVKPPLWTLSIGRRYLKGVVNSLAPVGSEAQGLTQTDLDAAEAFAWRILASRMIGSFIIGTWTSAPPWPLFEIWDLMASSYILALVGQRKNVDDAAAVETQEKLMSQAVEMIRNIINPINEADRMYLIKADGAIQHKRSNIAVPKIVSTTGVVFFPADKEFSTAWGDSLAGSIEKFVDSHSIKTGY